MARGAALANPFQNIARLSVGDFLAKTLNFLAFVYLARVLGVASFGVLEFANSILTYFLLLGDAGLELWGTREAAQTRDLRDLVARVVPLRLLLATVAFALLLLLLPFLPNYPALRAVLMLFGLTLFAQAASLKWVFLGQEKMARVASGLLIAQFVFALAAFLFIRSATALLWVPVLRFAGELAMAAYFAWLFARAHGGLRLVVALRGSKGVLRPALTMGASHGLAQLNYNFDSVLLGFLLGAQAVGVYNAAYRPVTMSLALPVTYFLGLFPALSRAYAEGGDSFRELVSRSLRLCSLFVVPLGVGGTLLAGPLIHLLFGPDYAPAASALQLLSWSAVLVVLRGTFRQALNAAGRARLDLRCAAASAAWNLGLNLLLIPRFGILGAAAATVMAEALWVTMAAYCFYHYVARVNLLSYLLRPVAAGIAMGAFLVVARPLPWTVRAGLSMLVYLLALLLLGETRIRYRRQLGKV